MMKDYRGLAWRSLLVHGRRSAAAVASIALSVGLVVAVFSMIDALVRFERAEVERKEGSYHILVRQASSREAAAIAARPDVERSGFLYDFGLGRAEDLPCAFASIEEDIAPCLIFRLGAGRHPRFRDEVAVEAWFLASRGLKLGEGIELALPSGERLEARIVGSMDDIGATKAAALPAVFLAPSWAAARDGTAALAGADCFVRFRAGTDIAKAEASIAAGLGLPATRIGRNEGLLALSLQSRNSRVAVFYAIGAFLSLLVLAAAVVMISNVFNISVRERVRQFGLLRCLGASRSQVGELVRREGLAMAGIGIPAGVLVGEAFTLACSLFLKYGNGGLYGGMRAFSFSPLGAAAGSGLGLLAVLLASARPAAIAARLSPLAALGSGERTSSARAGTRLPLPVELRMGFANALGRRKSFALMSASMGLGVVLFLGFSVLVNPAFLGVRTTKAYTADVAIASEGGIDPAMVSRIASVEGVEAVWGRRSAFVDARFEPSRIEPSPPARAPSSGGGPSPAAPMRSRLLSYDARQLAWAASYIVEGRAEESAFNASRGVIAARKSWSVEKGGFVPVLAPRLGDRIEVESGGRKTEFVVMAIADSIPYYVDSGCFATLVTTEALFEAAAGPSPFCELDIRLSARKPDAAVSAIGDIVGDSARMGDRRQYNAEGDRAFLTVAAFIYGFTAIIALIAALNVANAMNASVSSRTRYFGTLRAIGLSLGQMRRMVAAEAGLYCASGLGCGALAGLGLQKAMLGFLRGSWTFPWASLAIAVGFACLSAALSSRGPLKRLERLGLPDALSSP